MKTLTYIKNLVKDKHVASITPSSKFTVERVLKKIDFTRKLTIAEYGPGTGVITRQILSQLSTDSKLIAFETNPNFCEILKRSLVDSRFEIHNRSAEDISEVIGKANADYIVSGIPFSMLPPEVKDRILRNTAETLTATGTFLTYQVFPPPASLDKFLRACLKPDLQLVDVEYEFRNIPPMRIYEIRKA
ncbi:methyltransferase domain-containing protein [bacterium]|nr:methyltransferase domain-containing protein [bacterium]